MTERTPDRRHPSRPTDAGSGDDDAVRIVMGMLYGSAAALIGGDRDGAAILLDDVRRRVPALSELLVTISLATLERLEHSFADESLRASGARRPHAREMLRSAERYGVAPNRAVHAAAWRLEAVRCNDRSRAMTEVVTSGRAGRADQLVAGGVALLAAAVAEAAIVRDEEPLDAARRLCLAASAG